MTSNKCEINNCNSNDLSEHDTPLIKPGNHGPYFMTLCKEHRESFIDFSINCMFSEGRRYVGRITCE